MPVGSTASEWVFCTLMIRLGHHFKWLAQALCTGDFRFHVDGQGVWRDLNSQPPPTFAATERVLPMVSIRAS